MEIFLSSLKIVAPLFIYMAAGYVLARLKVIDEVFSEKTAKFCFKFAMPVMLLNNMYKADIVSQLRPKLIIYYVAAIVLLIGILWLTIPLIIKSKKTAGVVIQAIYRGNFMLFAFHIINSLYGEAAMGMASAVFAVATALYNFAAVVVLSFFSSEVKPNIPKTLKDIALNPLILGTALGVILSLLKVDLGSTIEGVMDKIGALVTPIMLIALGGKFKFKSVKQNVKYIVLSTFGRLIAAPLIIIGFALLLNFRGMELGIILALSAAPVATSTYPMALHYKCNADLAGETVVFTSAFSTLTLFLWIFILKYFALL